MSIPISLTIDQFDWGSYKYNAPKNLKVIRANDHCLVLERNRDGYRERFVIGKTGDEFSLFRTNLSLGEADISIDPRDRICHGPIGKVLAMVGYKTGWKPA